MSVVNQQATIVYTRIVQEANFPNSNTVESQGADISSVIDPAWIDNP
jgi:hypothetical protein